MKCRFKSNLRIVECVILSILLAVFLTACGSGGGGGNGDSGSKNAIITGTVAGTVVVAVDENDNEVDRDTATGTPKTFTLTVPVGGNYRFYFIENENTPNEKVYLLYQGTTNVFSITSAVTIDLGFVDTTSGVAVPTNNLLDISGVTSGGENPDIPHFLSFAGTYSFNNQYDLNISDGVTLGVGNETFEVTRIDSQNLSVQVSGNNPDEGSYSGQFPFVMSDNIAMLPTRPYDMGNANLLDFLILSDGNNMVYAGIGQEKSNPADISLGVANWLRIPQSVTIDSFVGTWSGIFYNDPNLRNIDDGFSVTVESITISKVDFNTITVNLRNRNETFLLDVTNGRATLNNAPVTGTSAIYHALSIVTDGSGLSLYIVATELNDPTDVSVTVGLATKQ